MFFSNTNKGGEIIQVRDKHATISVLTFTRQKLPAQDEYIDFVQENFKTEWLKRKTSLFQTEIDRYIARLNAQFHPRGRNKIMECLQFGGNSEFWRDFPDEFEIQMYFYHCYEYAIKYIGYMQTDKNIICAIIVTEANRRNLFVYYLPVTEVWHVKKLSTQRSESGNKLQHRDIFGYPVYDIRRKPHEPLLCHSQFWRERGGELAYSTLQENFYQTFSKRYGAKRGESNSRIKYTVPDQAQRYNRQKGDDIDLLPPVKGIWV